MKHLLVPAAMLLLSACVRPWQEGDKRLRGGDPIGAYEAYLVAKRQAPSPPSPEVSDRMEAARIEAARQLHRRALERADKGDLDGAIRLLERANKIDPANADAAEALQSVASPDHLPVTEEAQ